MNKHRFAHFSVRGYLINIIKQKGLEVNRNTMVTTANDLRANNSPSFIAEELYKEAKIGGQNCIIESIRTVGEANALMANGNFTLLAVDALPKVRYERIVQRASETDHVSYQTFMEDEKKEMKSDDPNKQNINACMELADFKILNNGSYAELYDKIDLILKKIK